MEWSARVEELLYEGESVASSVAVGEHDVVVTSHRVLAFTPTLPDAPNYRAIERPNVEGVTARDDSDPVALTQAVLWGVFGFVLVVGGFLFEMGDLISLPETYESGAVGTGGGMVSLFETVFTALSLLDEAIAVFGLGVLAVAAYYTYRYRESREHVVAVVVAGADDVRLPVADEATQGDATASLRAALDGAPTARSDGEDADADASRLSPRDV